MKVILYMAMTLNGYISREDDSTPWTEDAWNAYTDAVKRVGSIIIGRRTYEIMKDEELKKIGNPLTVVMTSKTAENEKPHVIFVQSAEEALQVLSERGYKETLLAGGSQTNGLFMKKKLVNEIIIDVEPFIFGNGKPLIPPSVLETELSLKESRKLGNNSIQLHYEVK